MKTNKDQKIIFILILLLLGNLLMASRAFSADSAKNQEASTYGELLLIEKKEEASQAWQLEALGMQEFSNPYLDVSGVSISVKKSIGSFVYVGPEYTRYFTSDSDVNKSVSQALKTDTIQQTIYRPRGSIYGVASVIPVSGHLNLFSRSTMPFELEVSLGYGAVQYDRKSSVGALLWRIGPRAFFSPNFGMEFQFGQELEAPFSGSGITKSHARLGFVTRF